jgi:hypothetical protein
MRTRLACLLCSWIVLIGCGSEDEGQPPRTSEQCCPLARLCLACDCDHTAQMAVDEDDTQACIQELESAWGCSAEVRGSAKRTCDANGQRPEAEVERSIVGDWFTCQDDTCTTLSSTTGQRYTDDGRMFGLSFPQPADRNSIRPFYDGDPYCLMEETGTYRYDEVTGEISTTSREGFTATATFFISGDFSSSRRMLRVRENATGASIIFEGRQDCDVSGAEPLD